MIKVMIQRRVPKELIDPYQQAASKIMLKAMQSPGFISGESLRNADDEEDRVVFANYRSEGDWSRWYHSAERRAMIEALRPMLEGDEKITVLEHI
ncbi:antibiotic biosynthesis monooxygenase [Motiliproteus sp. SC1-56]|uniref:antibiotic biosynthesis monooxygenase n=1 Tax=Motiliproteus sp. SC1-56 TaxID=2799565 RepID=UPI001A8C2099|nr:antibiotic biosynthesis monooxygenase [Motiliproteus sp. SC1-56]